MAAAYPISFLPYTHNQILHAVNLGSLPAWFSLLVLPRWHMTRKIAAAPIMLPLPYRSPPARVVLASMGGMAVAT